MVNKMKIKPRSLRNLNNCPCGSQKAYAQCCGRFHSGELPKTALELMRSRYSAYALELIDYIIKTTHPKNTPQDRVRWKKELLHFAQNTSFEELTILEFTEEGDRAYVTFFAKLSQNGRDASFMERSQFEKLAGRWLYLGKQGGS